MISLVLVGAPSEAVGGDKEMMCEGRKLIDEFALG